LFLSAGKYDPGCSSRFRIFSPSPDPGVEKAPEPGSGSATLENTYVIVIDLHSALSVSGDCPFKHCGARYLFEIRTSEKQKAVTQNTALSYNSEIE
jgi:hypothetical protein